MMDYLERYIFAVQSYLPEDQRADIGRELKANIQDQWQMQCEAASDNDKEQQLIALLQKWGHPRQVAQQYVSAAPLISSELMPLYWQTLRYVLGFIFVLQSLKSGMLLLEADYLKLVQAVLQLVFGFLDSASFAFAVITLIYYAISLEGPVSDWLKMPAWSVQQLPPVQRPWQRISGTDIVTELVSSAFVLLLLWHPVWMSAASLAELRITMAPEVVSWIWPMTTLLSVSLLFNLWCSWRPYWTQATLGFNIAQNMVYIGGIGILLNLPQLLVATAKPLPRLLTDLDANYVLRHVLIFVAVYLIYLVGKDLYHLRQLRRVTTSC